MHLISKTHNVENLKNMRLGSKENSASRIKGVKMGQLFGFLFVLFFLAVAYTFLFIGNPIAIGFQLFPVR